MVAREVQSRRLDIEYEAFRISASVQESFRLDPGYTPENPSIIGYGLYDLEGRALNRGGTAPLQVDLSLASPNTTLPRAPGSKSSVILFRPLGMQGGRGMGPAGMGPGAGLGMGPGMGPGAERRDSGHEMRSGVQPGIPGTGSGGAAAFGAVSPPLSEKEPHFMWLEYSRGALDREISLLFAGAAFVSLLLAGLYASTLRLYKRNEELRLKELGNRELVQLGEAARTLVHEIKNPLGIIRIQAATLRKTGTERVKESALVIEDEVMRLAGLADRIREFLKSGSGEVRSFEIGPWLETFAERYGTDSGERGERGLALRAELGNAKVSIDPQHLTQALDNLVANAFDATAATAAGDPGGEAGESGPGEDCGTDTPPPEIHALLKGASVVISVLDRGGGVPQTDRERIFEPFFTTREKGSGIGLALARKVARSAGGDIVYEDRQGGGACFTLSLPRLPR